jgi:hypothetical protein
MVGAAVNNSAAAKAAPKTSVFTIEKSPEPEFSD